MRYVMFSVLFAGFWSFLLLPGIGYGHASATEADGTGTRISWVDMSETEGTTITVTTYTDELTVNGDCSLREAIQAANSDAAVDACPAGNGDDLILLPSGVYTLSLTGRSEDDNTTGDLDIRSNLVINGAGSNATVIDANSVDRALHVLTATVDIRGLTVQNGRAADGAGSGCGADGSVGCPGEPGGGMANFGSTRLIDVIVQNSRSGDGGENADWSMEPANGGDGGGIANLGKLEMFASQVVGNRSGDGRSWVTSGGAGGGIFSVGVLTSDELLVSRNQTGWGGPVPKGVAGSGVGGGITNPGMMTITKGQILANSAGGGGGAYNGGKAWFFDSAIGHNVGGTWIGTGGGGVMNRGEITLDRCSIFYNIAGWGGDGGGLLNYGAASLMNCTVSGNRSGMGGEYYWSFPGGDGGGILNQGILLLQNSTITDNQTREGDCTDGICKSAGGSGGGLANDGGAVTIHNSLIAQNSVADGGSGPDCWGVFVSTGYNLVQNTKDCTLDGDSTGNILDHFAWLAPLADNGGPTLTHALYAQSPALNAGSCIDSDGAPVTVDQRGEVRPQGVACDMGAFESSLSYTSPLKVHLPLTGSSKE
jgi:CSLREA domain-containing protein